MFRGQGLAKTVRTVAGGESRQQSVENALATITDDTELVAVHDAVRPFVAHEVIEKVIREASHTGAAIVGIVPVDTVKQVHRNKVRGTLPRERLILTQTPQVFRLELLRQAFEKARQDLFIGTDESSLVERLEQVEVSVVLGTDRNIKITQTQRHGFGSAVSGTRELRPSTLLENGGIESSRLTALGKAGIRTA